MKDETAGVAIKKFVALKPKFYSFLVDNSEHKMNVWDTQWKEFKVKTIE